MNADLGDEVALLIFVVVTVYIFDGAPIEYQSHSMIHFIQSEPYLYYQVNILKLCTNFTRCCRRYYDDDDDRIKGHVAQLKAKGILYIAHVID